MKDGLDQTSSWVIAIVLSLLFFGITVMMMFRVADRVRQSDNQILEAKRSEAKKEHGEGHGSAAHGEGHGAEAAHGESHGSPAAHGESHGSPAAHGDPHAPASEDRVLAPEPHGAPARGSKVDKAHGGQEEKGSHEEKAGHGAKPAHVEKSRHGEKDPPAAKPVYEGSSLAPGDDDKKKLPGLTREQPDPDLGAL